MCRPATPGDEAIQNRRVEVARGNRWVTHGENEKAAAMMMAEAGVPLGHVSSSLTLLPL